MKFTLSENKNLFKLQEAKAFRFDPVAAGKYAGELARSSGIKPTAQSNQPQQNSPPAQQPSQNVSNNNFVTVSNEQDLENVTEYKQTETYKKIYKIMKPSFFDRFQDFMNNTFMMTTDNSNIYYAYGGSGTYYKIPLRDDPNALRFIFKNEIIQFDQNNYGFDYFGSDTLPSDSEIKIDNLQQEKEKFEKDFFYELNKDPNLKYMLNVNLLQRGRHLVTKTYAESKIIKEYREEINNLLIPNMQRELKFNKLPTLNFVEDEENAKDMFGRTAHYNPNTSEITVYISGRHPKDIMRSVAHEVVHHAQNCRGEFSNAFNLGEEGYAQSNNHLRNMEKEAYLLGNMLFRDWEDNLKKQRNSNTMINEKALRAKIRQLIMQEMQDASEVKNEPVNPHGKDCGCDDCKENKKKRLQMSGITNMTEATQKAVQEDKEVMPLNEWRRLELNSLLMSKFGIVAPHAVLGEKKNKKPDADGDGVPDWADKKPNDPEVGSKETKPKTKAKKGKVPPQLQAYVKGRGKKDEGK